MKNYFEKYNNTGAVFILTGKTNDFHHERSKRAAPKIRNANIFGGKFTDNNYCFFFTYSSGRIAYTSTTPGKIDTYDEFDDKNDKIVTSTTCQVKDTKKDGKSGKYYTLDKFTMKVTTKAGKDVEINWSFKNSGYV